MVADSRRVTSVDVAMPRAIASLDRDHRGFPIFHSVARHEDGRPNWRGLDGRIVGRCIEGRTCIICGAPLGLRVAFIGGPISVETMIFQEPPMHPPCAEYSVAVCPFLTRSGWDRTKTPLADRQRTDDPAGTLGRWQGVAVVVVDVRGYRPYVPEAEGLPGSTVLFEVYSRPRRVTWVVPPTEHGQ